MKRRIFAWIGIIFVPLMFLISLILSIVDSPIAGPFLMVTIVLTVAIPGGIFLLTRYPKDVADIYHRVKGAGEDSAGESKAKTNTTGKATKTTKTNGTNTTGKTAKASRPTVQPKKQNNKKTKGKR